MISLMMFQLWRRPMASRSLFRPMASRGAGFQACHVGFRAAVRPWTAATAMSHRIQSEPLLKLALLIAVTLTLSAQDNPAQHNPHTTPSDISQGKRIFQGHCAGCHGPGGEGGRGAILK
jgi:mono/diheme cytochrome c family protein